MLFLKLTSLKLEVKNFGWLEIVKKKEKKEL
jgi:hypothetical protein